MIRIITLMNSYEKQVLLKNIENIIAHGSKALSALVKGDEVDLTMCLNVIEEKIRATREILY